MPVTVLNVEMWVVTENGSYSAVALPVPRENVGQPGRVLSTQLKILITSQAATAELPVLN